MISVWIQKFHLCWDLSLWDLVCACGDIQVNVSRIHWWESLHLRGPAGGMLTKRSYIIFYCHFFMTLPLRNNFWEEWCLGFSVCGCLFVCFSAFCSWRREIGLTNGVGSAEGPVIQSPCLSAPFSLDKAVICLADKNWSSVFGCGKHSWGVPSNSLLLAAEEWSTVFSCQDFLCSVAHAFLPSLVQNASLLDSSE